MRSILQHHSGIISSNLCICSFLSTIHLHKLSKQIWGYLPNCTQCQRVGTSGGSPGPLHWFHCLVQRAPSVHMCLLNEWLSGSVDGNQGGIKIRWHCKVLSCVWLFAAPRTAGCQAPQSMGFFRQEFWRGLPFPTPGGLPDPGIKPPTPCLLHWQVDSWPREAWNQEGI